MHTLAYGLADALAATDDVVVATRPEHAGASSDAFERRLVIEESLGADARALNSIAPDVWLGMNGGLLPLLPKLNRPSFMYLHGNDFLSPWLTYGSRWIEPIKKPYMGKFRRYLRARAMRRTAGAPLHYFTNSRRTSDLAKRALHLPDEAVSVCPPGVSEAFFQTHDPSGDTSRIEIVSVSRLTRFSRRKNIDGVLTAIAQLTGEIEIFFTVVGDGDDLPRLKKIAADLDIACRVRFAGRLTHDELLACYRKSDLFILASKASAKDVEGFGIVYLEAAASGVPVMGSAEGGATDAIEDGTNGILLEDSSPETIADGIRRFATERHQFQSNCVREWAEAYRWSRIAQQLRDVVRERLER
jgi:glycosyltransferase involved in cell wall biosynthesis